MGDSGCYLSELQGLVSGSQTLGCWVNDGFQPADADRENPPVSRPPSSHSADPTARPPALHQAAPELSSFALVPLHEEGHRLRGAASAYAVTLSPTPAKEGFFEQLTYPLIKWLFY